MQSRPKHGSTEMGIVAFKLTVADEDAQRFKLFSQGFLDYLPSLRLEGVGWHAQCPYPHFIPKNTCLLCSINGILKTAVTLFSSLDCPIIIRQQGPGASKRIFAHNTGRAIQKRAPIFLM
jgi:hypothetical protein